MTNVLVMIASAVSTMVAILAAFEGIFWLFLLAAALNLFLLRIYRPER